MDRSNNLHRRPNPFIQSQTQINEDRDWNHQITEEFPGPVSLIETTNPDEIHYDDDLYHHADSGFNDFKAICLDQGRIVSRGHDPAAVGFEMWSPATCFGGGARLLFDASPVDSIYESHGYPWH